MTNERGQQAIGFGGEAVRLTAEGALLLPDHATLVVADLHLEKGSAFARRGAMLPPYDTLATLERLERCVARYAPKRVVSLGDGFHDTAGARLITGAAADLLHRLAARVDWHWLRGNHDPHLPSTLPGTIDERLILGGLELRHQPAPSDHAVIAGHLHPKARIAGKRRSLSRPCFVWSETTLVMPAFGSFTGGLNILDEAFASWLPRPRVCLIGERRLFPVDHRHLVGETAAQNRHRASG